MNQAEVLEYLQKEKTATTNQIKDAIGSNTSSIYSKLESISRHGWAEKEKADDGNSVVYIITEKGEGADPDSIRPPTY